MNQRGVLIVSVVINQHTLDGFDLDAQIDRKTLLGKELVRFLGDLLVDSPQKCGQGFEHGHLCTQSAPDAAHLEANDAGPNDTELFRHRINVQRAGVSDKVTIITGDIFKEDFSKATVVTLYLLPGLNIKLRPTLLAMKPGTRIVSNTFTMGLWMADQTIEGDSGHVGYLWIVPANAEGHWTISGLPEMGSQPATLTLRQQYQEINGTLQAGGTRIEQPIAGRMNGNEITFHYRDMNGMPRTFIGNIENGALKGYLKDAPSLPISAHKTS